MSRTARFWKGAGAVALGGLLLSGTMARGTDDPPPLSEQMLRLARQAEAAGRPGDAQAAYRQVLKLDPDNETARQALARGPIRRVSRPQDPAMPGNDPIPPPLPGDVEPAGDVTPPTSPATIDEADRLNRVEAERLTNDINSRLAKARNLMNTGQSSQALDELRLAISAVRGDTAAPLDARGALERRLQVEYRSALRREEAEEAARDMRLKLEAAASQEQRALSELNQRQESVSALMTQYDTLMMTGLYDILYAGGMGDIDKNTAPFFDARVLATHARAMEPRHPAPRAGIFVASAVQFYAQALAFEDIKEYRYQLSMNDVLRAGVPFPDTKIIEYPDVEFFRRITELRRSRYEVVSLEDTDEQTKGIRQKLDQVFSFPFDADTPLEEVIKYIQTVTADATLFPKGIPIYLDEVGMQEANNVTAASPVKISLEGVPLRTILRLMLKQIGLTFTVTKGVLTITSPEGVSQITENRVYPVADLSIIPGAIFGSSGGGGGMGGGMGGMGGGMGGGGMGGMGGGGMGGMGGGGMGGMGGMGGGMGGMGGGMRSVPAQAPGSDPSTLPLEKKSN